MTGESPTLKFMGTNGGADASPMETVAERLEVDPQTGEVSAAGRVRSFLREEDGPIVITAGRMHADPETGWIHYFSNPRIVQQSNSITGNTIRYNHREQQLVVEETVESFLIQESPVEEKVYKVEADRLLYKRADLRARYEGNVRVSTEDLIVAAPFVDFVFAAADQNQLQEIVAWGGVEITQGDRNAHGDQAVPARPEPRRIQQLRQLLGTALDVPHEQDGLLAHRRLRQPAARCGSIWKCNPFAAARANRPWEAARPPLDRAGAVDGAFDIAAQGCRNTGSFQSDRPRGAPWNRPNPPAATVPSCSRMPSAIPG
ncbi:MAG: hypothetical protein IIA41_13435 [SAR324 cluster bacterium]|nr:hypothetical protein [SAR324 cluster bacterium]